MIEDYIVTIEIHDVKLDDDEEPEDQPDNKVVQISMPDKEH